jgi:branched-chain amino acid transport system permease protein
LNHLLDGLLLGGLYAGAALGLTLVFGVMRMVNLAHGELLIAGAYLASLVSVRFGLDPLLGLLVVAPLLFVVAYPLQRWVLNALIPHGLEAPLVATFGLSVVAQTLFVLAFGGNPRAVDAPYTLSGTSLGGTTVRTIFLVALAGGLLLVVASHLGLTRLRFGKALRAAAEDAEAAATLGIDVRHVYAATFAIAAALPIEPRMPPPSFAHAQTAKARKAPTLSSSRYAPTQTREPAGFASAFAICVSLLETVSE